MIVPSRRLSWLWAFTLPFLILAPLSSLLRMPILAAILTVIGISLVDAILSLGGTKGLEIRLPGIVRLTRDREGSFPVEIGNQKQHSKTVLLGIPFPPEIRGQQEEIPVFVPEGAAFSRLFVNCTASKRGKYRLRHSYLEIESPLRLWQARFRLETPAEIRVYPNLLEEGKKNAALFLNRGLYGSHARRMVGKGREFEKLREYVHGDDYGDIDWKATARRHRPITRVFQVEHTQEVYVVIDFSRLSSRLTEAEPILERYVTAALVLGTAAQRQGDLFGLVTFSDKIDTFLRATKGKSHYGACRDAIYTLMPDIVSPDFDTLFTLLRLKLRKRALLFFLTDLSDPVLADGFVRNVSLVCRKHLVLVNMVRPPKVHPLFERPDAHSLDSLYENLGGHLIWRDLVETGRLLNRYGVSFTQLKEPRLSAELISQYLDVKQRQLL